MQPAQMRRFWNLSHYFMIKGAQKVEFVRQFENIVLFYVSYYNSHNILVELKPLFKYQNIMALIGYARVSSVGQSLQVQLDKLKHCRKIFQEKKSATGGKRLQLYPKVNGLRKKDKNKTLVKM